MSCHPARIPPGWRRGAPGRCFVQSPAPARFHCRCGMGPRGKSAQKYGAAGPAGWACRCCAPSKPPGCPLRASRRVTAPPVPAYLMALSSRITGQPMQGGGIPLHGLAGARPLQSGYSPANLLRLSSIYRYSIPQLAENRLEKNAAGFAPAAFLPQNLRNSAAVLLFFQDLCGNLCTVAAGIHGGLFNHAVASASLMPLCSIR